MRGINVRKIAAIAGVAVLGLSAFAVADVVYGSTQLVDQNGQPTVKIYVGSKAAISDGVAAANIAAKIANEAYKSSTLTAQVSGTPLCTVGSGVGGTGTCSIVESSKKVTLSVTVPGTVAGAHTFKTLISDTVDKTPANRVSTTGDDKYDSSITTPDTSGGTPPSPLRGATAPSTNAKELLYRIGSSQFTGFADASVSDDQAASVTYTEQQNFWVGSQAGAVKYDTTDKNIDVNKYSAMVYNVKFMGNDFGIPVCTGNLNTSQTDDWTSCATDANERTAKHRVKFKFLGSDWIISDMTASSTTNPSTTAVVAGGQVKLAKEAKYGIVNVGQTLDAGTFKIRLSDISVAVGSTNLHPAIIDILDANEAVVGQVQVNPDSTYTFTQAGTGSSVKIHVYKTAPGFTLNAKWAEMAIYNDEITLKDASRYNLVSSTATDKDFWVSLMWKNKDFPGGAGLTSSNNQSDSLREIVVYQYENFNKAATGDVFNFLKSTPTFKVTYSGLDLTDDDYIPLTLESQAPSTGGETVAVSASTVNGETDACATGTTATYTNPRWIKISTGGQTLLGGSSNIITGNYMFDSVYYDPVGLIAGSTTNTTITAQTGTNATGGTTVTPTSATTYMLQAVGNSNLAWFVIPTTIMTPVTLNVTGATFNASNTLPAGYSFYTNSVNGTVLNPLTAGNGNTSIWQPKLFWKVSGRNCYNWNAVTANSNASTSYVRFDTAGDNSQAQGAIFFGNNATTANLFGAATGTYQGAINMQEDAGKLNTTSNNLVYTSVPFIATDSTTVGSGGFRFQPNSASTQKVYYRGLVGGDFATDSGQDVTFISERGSKSLSVGSTQVSLKVAKKVGQPTFTFATADSAVTAGGAEDYTMGVGDSKVFGGVTVTVKAIDATAGSCSVLGPSGTPACTVDTSTATAVIQPNNAASVVVSEPYPLGATKLVYSDTQAQSAGVAILVGGPMVNTMTADALQDSSVDLKTDGPLVKEIGNKIVVAGYTADDTLSAADQFIAGVKRQ